MQDGSTTWTTNEAPSSMVGGLSIAGHMGRTNYHVCGDASHARGASSPILRYGLIVTKWK